MSLPPSDPYAPSRPARTALARETLALGLIVLGILGLIYAAYQWCEPAGHAAVSTAVLAAGVYLGYDR